MRMMGQSQSREWCLCRGAVSVENVCLSEGLLRRVRLREGTFLLGRGMSVEGDYLQRVASVLDVSVWRSVSLWSLCLRRGVHLRRRCAFGGVGVCRG